MFNSYGRSAIPEWLSYILAIYVILDLFGFAPGTLVLGLVRQQPVRDNGMECGYLLDGELVYGPCGNKNLLQKEAAQ